MRVACHPCASIIHFDVFKVCQLLMILNEPGSLLVSLVAAPRLAPLQLERILLLRLSHHEKLEVLAQLLPMKVRLGQH